MNWRRESATDPQFGANQVEASRIFEKVLPGELAKNPQPTRGSAPIKWKLLAIPWKARPAMIPRKSKKAEGERKGGEGEGREGYRE